MVPGRKLIALFCMAALLLASLAPASSGPLHAIMAPFWLFFALLAVAAVRRATEECDPGAFPFVPAVPARAPPLK
ncbi:MAG: hypothetical protein ACLQGV_14500 [Bryobacteraceae bacterium]